MQHNSMPTPSRLNVLNHDIINSIDSTVEDADMRNYVVLYLDPASDYFAWRSDPDELTLAEISKVIPSTTQRGMVELVLNIEHAGRVRDFSMVLPLGWLRTASMFSTVQNSSSLFIIEPADHPLNTGLVHDTDTFKFHVLAPENESDLARRLLTVFQQVLTDTNFYNLSEKEYDLIRGDLVSTVYGLVRGEEQALLQAFSYINVFDQAEARKLQVKYYDPTFEEKKVLTTRTLLYKLFLETHPAQFSVQGSTFEQWLANREEISEFEQIIANNDMAEIFSPLVNAPVPVPAPNASGDDKIAYYASTTAVLPVGMAALSDRLATMPAFDRNWNSIPTEISPKELITNGDELAAMLVVIAVRICRLGELRDVDDHEDDFHPVNVIMQSLTNMEEGPWWFVSQTQRLIGAGDNHPFSDMMLSQMPSSYSYAFPDEAIMDSVPGRLFHDFGHLLAKDPYGPESLRPAFAHLPILASFLEKVITNFAAAEREGDSHEGCPSFAATIETLRLGFDNRDVVQQLAGAYLSLAELNALRNTEFEQNSLGWREYLQDYLYEISNH
jgi:hypothetical protein